MFLFIIVSQAVGELRQQESHPLEMQVLSPNWMDSDLLRLPLVPLLWAFPLLLLLDYHARPLGDPVFTLSWVKVLVVHKVSLTRIYHFILMVYKGIKSLICRMFSRVRIQFSMCFLRAHLDMDGRGLCFKWWPTSWLGLDVNLPGANLSLL